MSLDTKATKEAVDEAIQAATQEGLHFFYVRADLGRAAEKHYSYTNYYKDIPTITVAYAFNEDGIVYGAAFCAPEDIFVKKHGRRLAFLRMLDMETTGYIRCDMHQHKPSHQGVREMIVPTLPHYMVRPRKMGELHYYRQRQ